MGIIGVVSDIISLTGDVMTGILTKEPMNYYIAAGLVTAAVGIFAKAKQASKG